MKLVWIRHFSNCSSKNKREKAAHRFEKKKKIINTLMWSFQSRAVCSLDMLFDLIKPQSGSVVSGCLQEVPQLFFESPWALIEAFLKSERPRKACRHAQTFWSGVEAGLPLRRKVLPRWSAFIFSAWGRFSTSDSTSLVSPRSLKCCILKWLSRCVMNRRPRLNPHLLTFSPSPRDG